MIKANEEFYQVVVRIFVEREPLIITCMHMHSWLPAAVECQRVYKAKAEAAFVARFVGGEMIDSPVELRRLNDGLVIQKEVIGQGRGART